LSARIAGYNFGGGIYSIVGIVTNGEVKSHINYWNDKNKFGHNDLYPNKFFGRWLWTCGIPEMLWKTKTQKLPTLIAIQLQLLVIILRAGRKLFILLIIQIIQLALNAKMDIAGLMLATRNISPTKGCLVIAD
jgi:hypothetical protein